MVIAKGSPSPRASWVAYMPIGGASTSGRYMGLPTTHLCAICSTPISTVVWGQELERVVFICTELEHSLLPDMSHLI